VSATPRISRARVLGRLRVASRKGDKNALGIAIAEMRTLACSPRYWEKYLDLLDNPLARLVDLLVIKRGERIAEQKGWTGRRRSAAPRAGAASRPVAASRPGVASRPTPAGRRRPRTAPSQPSLFPDWP
jgi:hypothetical protein